MYPIDDQEILELAQGANSTEFGIKIIDSVIFNDQETIMVTRMAAMFTEKWRIQDGGHIQGAADGEHFHGEIREKWLIGAILETQQGDILNAHRDAAGTTPALNSTVAGTGIWINLLF